MKTFEVQYKCGNCGREWAEQYEAGDRVEAGLFENPHVESHACTHRISCEFCRTIKCIQCTSGKDVRITARKPIGLIDGAQADPHVLDAQSERYADLMPDIDERLYDAREESAYEASA